MFAAVAAVAGGWPGAAAHAQGSQAPVPTVNVTVDVIAPTPLPCVGLSLGEIPAPVETLSAQDVDRSGALEVSDLLNRRLNGVHVNAIQNNI